MSGQVTALITGANSGIGRATALRLAAKGDRVAGAMRGLKAHNAAAAAELAAAGVTPVEIDVSDDASVASGVAAALEALGHIDVLMNCAGIMPRGVTEAFTVAQVEQAIQVNLIGPFRMMKAVLPHMRARGSGLLINVTSIGGRMASPGSGLYAATKWGLEGMAESIGYEVSKLGIDSVVLEPSLYLTDLNAKGFTPADEAVLEGYAPIRDLAARVSATFRPAVAASGVSTDPASAAEFVEELIRMKPGTRPVRAVVGFDTGTRALNAASEPLQAKFLELMGVADFARMTPTE